MAATGCDGYLATIFLIFNSSKGCLRFLKQWLNDLLSGKVPWTVPHQRVTNGLLSCLQGWDSSH